MLLHRFTGFTISIGKKEYQTKIGMQHCPSSPRHGEKYRYFGSGRTCQCSTGVLKTDSSSTNSQEKAREEVEFKAERERIDMEGKALLEQIKALSSATREVNRYLLIESCVSMRNSHQLF